MTALARCNATDTLFRCSGCFFFFFIFFFFFVFCDASVRSDR